PIPIRQVSPIVQPWSTARWPTVVSLPMCNGAPGSLCKTQPSRTLLRSPITIGSLSPRTIAENQDARLPPEDNVADDLGRWGEPDVLRHRLRPVCPRGSTGSWLLSLSRAVRRLLAHRRLGVEHFDAHAHAARLVDEP